jgi:hypothetical protein
MSDHENLNECRRILGISESEEEPIHEVDDEAKRKKNVLRQLDELSKLSGSVAKAVRGGQLEIESVIISMMPGMLNNLANIGLAFGNQQFYKKIKAIDPRDGLGT